MSYIFDTNMFMEDFDVNKYKGEKIYTDCCSYSVYNQGLDKNE